MNEAVDDQAQWGDLVVAGGARRREIRRRHRNGLDAVEVEQGGRRLVLTFLEPAPGGVHPGNIRIDAPPGAPAVQVTSVRRGGEEDPRLESRLLVALAERGGPGTYTLRLVQPTADGRPGWIPLSGIDPRYAGAAFRFDAGQPSPVVGTGPAVSGGGADLQASYLARDYTGLRQLILDRMAQTMPAWTETHAADIGITLVEILAYTGDDLSYYQDSVATEAYLATARQRISVRRHARLTGYRLGEGGQARAWVCLAVTEAVQVPLREVMFAAGPDAAAAAPVMPVSDLLPGPGTARLYSPVRAHLGSPLIGGGQRGGPVFTATPAHNQIALWAWGEHESVLRAGATHAVLADGWADPAQTGPSARRLLALQAGDVVIFEATAGPSGAGPPDPTQRHPVRLTAVHRSVDRLYDQAILEVTWAEAEALPFGLQVTAPGPDGTAVPCAVVRGNTILVGDGQGVSEELPAGRTVLGRQQLTWACAYPDPAAVGRHQASLLRAMPGAWREQIEAWRRDAQEGTALSESQLAQLRRLLGEDVLSGLGLGGGRPGEHERGHDHEREREPDHEHEWAAREAEALRHLILDADRLLSPRVRRLAVLAALARASGPLEPVLLREVADDWGTELAQPLSPHHPATWGPAADAVSQDARCTMPLLSLAPVTESAAESGAVGQPWTVTADVVGSTPGSRQVMVEMDDAGLAHLRFSPGDQPTGPVQASYQVGQGAAGNVPAEAINVAVPLTPGAAAALSAVRDVANPLPAVGGTDPESIPAAKAAIPGAFLTGQPRALVPADYTAIAQRVTGVRRAATVLRWTGIRYAAEVAVQPAVGEDPGQELLAAVGHALWPARRIGHDLWVRPPVYRPIVLGLQVGIGPNVVRAEVTAVLAALLGSGCQTDGTPALFSPDRLAFGQPVYASPIVAAVQEVGGVRTVVLTRFGFLGPPAPPTAPVPERLRLGPAEIARLDNDPDAPEHGYAVLSLAGGR